MKKRIITGLAALTSMVSSAAAQDIHRTAANVPMVQLNNGILMPQFGLGTFFQPSDSVCEQSCLTALKAGYRHIDTAHAYNDEAGVGRAVKESGIPREEIWITSKLWPTEYGEGKTLKAIDEMLGRLQLDYIDLLYVHQPVGDFVGAWKDMEKAVAMGKVMVLGISDFDASDEVFDKTMRESVVKPAVLQMECHPYAQRLAMREKAKRYEYMSPAGSLWAGRGAKALCSRRNASSICRLKRRSAPISETCRSLRKGSDYVRKDIRSERSASLSGGTGLYGYEPRIRCAS